MRKYLITGVLALVSGGFLTSCHDTDGAYSSIVEQKLQAYEQVFKEEFGEIDPNQDWGFGETNMSARMRTRADGNFANHVGAYPDANMWTSMGFLAPPPLTTSQKLRAQYYFQMNQITNPNRPDYGTRDFFVQQVYDGGDDPMPGKSPEVYKSIANTDITSGEHMDHLTAGSDHLHIYNFNNGNCSTNPNVANRDQTDVNDTNQQHEDKIQLMLNTPTNCFGYANSDASYVRDDRWTLVDAATIDNFCDHDSGFSAWLAARLPAGEEDVKCVDEYNRSYIGFDFDMLPDDKTFVWNYENGQKTTRKTVQYNWASPTDNMIYTENGVFSTFADGNTNITVKNGKVFYVLDAQTNQYCGEVKGIGGMDGHSEWTESAEYDPNGTNDNSLYLTNLPGHQSDHKALNLKFLAKKYEEGWLPVDTKQLKLWVKVGGCNDGYFSDWIVTFMPGSALPPNTTTIPIEPGGGTKKGKKITTYMWELTEVQKGRIMCEDLGVIRASDIDFNDLVFDAYIYNGQKKKKVVITDENYNPIGDPAITDEGESTRLTEIYILAAGGTLPISVAGERVKDHFEEGSISDAIIVNTCTKDGSEEGGSYSNPWRYYTNAQKIEKFDESINYLKDIKVIVRYGDKILELYSERGLAPHKICVPLDLANGINVKWPLERVVIKDAYQDFLKYVKNESENIIFTPDNNSEAGESDSNNPNGVSYINKDESESCWLTGKINTTKLFNEPVTYTPRNLNSSANEYGKYYIISTSEEEFDIPDTSKGYQPTDQILVRKRH